MTYVFPFVPFSALNFAHRSFVALDILALAAADSTRVFLPIGLALLVIPRLTIEPSLLRARCSTVAEVCPIAAVALLLHVSTRPLCPSNPPRSVIYREISKRQLNSPCHSFQ